MTNIIETVTNPRPFDCYDNMGSLWRAYVENEQRQTKINTSKYGSPVIRANLIANDNSWIEIKVIVARLVKYRKWSPFFYIMMKRDAEKNIYSEYFINGLKDIQTELLKKNLISWEKLDV